MIPQRFIYRTLLFLVFVGAVVGALHQVIWTAFQHNPWLNGVILAILLFGIFFNIRRILRLKPEAQWIEAFRTNAPGFSLQSAPRLLAPIAAVLGERQRRSRAALIDPVPAPPPGQHQLQARREPRHLRLLCATC